MDGWMDENRRGEKKEEKRHGGREKILSISTCIDKPHTRRLLMTKDNLVLKN